MAAMRPVLLLPPLEAEAGAASPVPFHLLNVFGARGVSLCVAPNAVCVLSIAVCVVSVALSAVSVCSAIAVAVALAIESSPKKSRKEILIVCFCAGVPLTLLAL
ncbi:hypothetical protein HDU98_009692 [Podochytrium sp. JEL0797]|nr:hypothetical protein HDU98_009692 [Podochytrium sp. JEL0797]